MPRFVKRQNPRVYKDYSSYKPFLRLDYFGRCCYCGVPEHLFGGENHFTVEHFVPKSKEPDLECCYFNLHYACDDCNRIKGKKWPSKEQVANGFQFWLPTWDRSIDHFRLAENGEIGWLSPMGEYTIKSIRLNRKFANDFRRDRLKEFDLFRKTLVSIRTLRLMLESGNLSDELAENLGNTYSLQIQVLETVRSRL